MASKLFHEAALLDDRNTVLFNVKIEKMSTD